MKDLFVKQPEFEKVSSRTLSKDATQWTKEIISYFHEEFPQLSHLPARLTFTQKDDTKGYAIGGIAVGHNNISVPVVVQDFHLKNMDVAVTSGNLVPLTEESVGMLFTHESAFSRAVPPDDVDPTVRLFSRDLHVPWSIDKYSSVLETIAGGITKKAQQDFLDEVESTPELKEGFINNGTYSVIEKIAELECDDAIANKNLVEKILPRNIFTIEKTGKFEYTAFLGNSDIDNKVSVILEEGNVKEAYATLEKSAAVKEYKEFTLPSEITSEAPIVNFDGGETSLSLFSDDKDNYNIKEAGGITTAVTSTGKFAIKMPPKMPSTSKVKIINQAITPSDGTTKVAEQKIYKKADFGVFLLENGVTKPVFLEKISNVNGAIDIEAFDGLNVVKISMWNGIKTPTFDEEKNTYFLPKDTNFIKLGSIKENLVSFPENSPTGDWVMNVDGNVYAFGGITFDKYAKLGHSLNDLSHADTRWNMVQMGVSPAEMEKIALKEGEKYYFSSKLSCPQPFSTYVEEWNEKLANATDLVDDSLLDMVKHAAVLTDSLTVDSVLSLRFLNKKNVAEFFEAIPMYEEVIMGLARLLMNVRLGLDSVPEEAVKEAMENLTIVTAKLYELQTLSKKVKN